MIISTPAGLVVHTGDYKFDHTPVDGWPTDYAKLAELSTRGVLALLADSTNADRPGWTPSEKVIDGAFPRAGMTLRPPREGWGAAGWLVGLLAGSVVLTRLYVGSGRSVLVLWTATGGR